MKRYLTALAVLLICCCLISCGGGSNKKGGSHNTSGNIRFMNAVPELSDIQMFLGEDAEPIILHYGELTDYLSIDSGEEMRLLVASSPLPIVDQRLVAGKNGDQTMVVFGDQHPTAEKYQVSARQFADEHEPAVSDRFDLKIVNAAVSTKSLKVFVTKPGVPIDPVLPFSQESFGGTTGYLEGNVSPAVITITDSKSGEVLYQSDPVDFMAHPVVTLYLLDQEGRGLPIVPLYSYDSDIE